MPNCFFCLEKIMIFSKSPALFHEYKQQEEATSSISMGYQKSMHSPKLKKQWTTNLFLNFQPMFFSDRRTSCLPCEASRQFLQPWFDGTAQTLSFGEFFGLFLFLLNNLLKNLETRCRSEKQESKILMSSENIGIHSGIHWFYSSRLAAISDVMCICVLLIELCLYICQTGNL